MADVNWLLSSVTQSSAALIAIVGGLLVSRYVSLHAEQEAAARRMSDLARRSGEAQRRWDEAQRVIDEYEVDEVLLKDDVYEVIVRDRFAPTRDEVLRAAEAHEDEINLQVFDERLTELCSEARRARETLQIDVPAGSDHDDWDAFRRDKGYRIIEKGLWDWTYEQIVEQRQEEARSDSDPYSSLSLNLSSFVGPNPQLSAIRDLAMSQQEQAAIERLYAVRDQAALEQRQLDEERRLASETYEAARQPEGFQLALEVLSTLALLGLAVPVGIMAAGPLTLPVWARVLVVAFFLLGVALLLRFLFVYARYLKGAMGRGRLPKHALGLLRP
jgi:hypothetical protein